MSIGGFAPAPPRREEWQQQCGQHPVPRWPAHSRPRVSDREAAVAEESLPIPGSARGPLCQARCCLSGLLALTALRFGAFNVFLAPAGVAWTAHLLSGTADAVSFVGASPLLAAQTIGSCVNHRCLGSLLTLLLTATICDFGASIMYVSASGGFFRLMGPIATDEGAPSALPFVGVWECVLLSSVSLQLALCYSAWKVYRSFREAGIYPPASANVRVRQEVSALELLCEAEDVALLSEHEYCSCTRNAVAPGDEAEPDIVALAPRFQMSPLASPKIPSIKHYL